VKAAIYTRVSTKTQADEGFSLTSQRKSCEAFVRAKGWKLAPQHMFEDAGVSGGKKSRPALNALLLAIQAGAVDVLVSPWMDRIGRSASHSLELYAIFDAAGLALWTPDGTKHDGSSAAAKASRNMIAMMAEFERDMIAERTRAGAVGKTERGAYNGGPIPFGYGLAEGGGLTVCEVEAKWIRHMFKRYAHEGASFYEIAKELEATNVGTRRGGRWTGNAVGEKIKRTMYVGVLKSGTRGTHIPLVDQETFDLAQQRIAATAKLNGNGRGRRASIHLLGRGLLRCECGTSMSLRTDPNGRSVYVCRRKKPDVLDKCDMPALPQPLVDQALLSYMADHVISPGMTESELDASRKHALRDATKAKAEAERVERQAENRRDKAREKWIDGKLADDEWKELQGRYDTESKQATDDVKRADATITALAEPDPQLLAAVERLRKDLDAAAKDAGSLPQYRVLVEKLYEHAEILRVETAPPPTNGELAEAQEAEYGDDPLAPTFTYRSCQYAVLPSLRPELADLYGVEPLVGGADAIGGHAWA
jgi:DNA invertase Pin-like site-specific DNA recombinase